MVDDDDGHVEGALQLSQVGEDGGDLTGVVLIDLVQSHEGVQQQEPGVQLRHGVIEALLVAVQVEPQRGHRDHVDGQGVQVEAAMPAQAAQACLDIGVGVLGHVEQGGPRLGHVEGVQAGCAGGDGDRQIEAHPGFPQLRAARDQADPGAGPEGVDQPAALGISVFQL